MFISPTKNLNCTRIIITIILFTIPLVAYVSRLDCEEIIFTEDKEYLWPRWILTYVSHESDRTLREFNSNAKLGWKSKQTPVTYLQLYAIYYAYGIYFLRLNVPFFSDLKSSARYYMHRRRHHLFILTLADVYVMYSIVDAMSLQCKSRTER